MSKPCRSQFSLRPKPEAPCQGGRYPWDSPRNAALTYLSNSNSLQLLTVPLRLR